MCDFFTEEELKEQELILLKNLKRTCILYRDALREQRRGRHESYRDLARREYNLGLIRYNKKTIKICSHSPYSNRISFYGSRNSACGGGVLSLYLSVVDNDDTICLSTNRSLPYPMEGEILKIIISKYEIESKEEFESFMITLKNKDLELI